MRWHLSAILAGNQLLTLRPCCFQIFQLAGKLHSSIVGFGREQPCNKLIFLPNPQCIQKIKLFTVTTHQQCGLVGQTNILLSAVCVILRVARGDILRLNYSFHLSVLMIACCGLAVISNLCPCCCTLSSLLKGKILL